MAYLSPFDLSSFKRYIYSNKYDIAEYFYFAMQTTVPDTIIAAIEELKKLADDIIHNRLKKIILFGSASRGEYAEGSDVDILILTDLIGPQLNEFNSALDVISTDLSLKYNIVLTPILKNTASFLSYSEVLPFYNNIIKEGIVLYG